MGVGVTIVKDKDPAFTPPDILRIRFDHGPGSVQNVTDRIIASIRHLNPSVDELGKLEIILAEVINNISEHAYQNQEGGVIEIIAAKRDKSICFHFIDSGLGLPGGRIPKHPLPSLNRPVADLPEGGFGWNLIHSLAKNIRYSREDGENHLFFQLFVDE